MISFCIGLDGLIASSMGAVVEVRGEIRYVSSHGKDP